jgi:hypothetical protein
MTVDYLLICEDVTETPDGRRTLTGVFDMVTAQVFWVQMSNVMVVARLRGRPNETAAGLLTWKQSDGTLLSQEEWELVVGPRGTALSAIEVAGPRLDKPDDYRLELRIAGELLATLVLPAVLEGPTSGRRH